MKIASLNWVCYYEEESGSRINHSVNPGRAEVKMESWGVERIPPNPPWEGGLCVLLNFCVQFFWTSAESPQPPLRRGAYFTDELL